MENIKEKLENLFANISFGSSSSKSEFNLNEQILSETSKSFLASIKGQSVKNKKLFFHNVVKIYMYKDDYNKNKLALLALKPLIVDNFYEIISKNLKYYNNEYIHIKEWTVKFSLAEGDIENVPQDFVFQPGSFFVVSGYEDVHYEKTDSDKKAENEEQSVEGSLVTVGNKKGVPANFTATFLQNFKDIMENDTFLFDKNKIIKEEKKTNIIKNFGKQIISDVKENSKYLAKLTYNLNDGKGIQKYYMETARLEISGKNDTRGKELVKERCKLNVELQPVPYAVIIYDDAKKQFKIGTYGDMKLDNSSLESKSLYVMKNNSTIQCLSKSGIVEIKFETLK